MVRRSPLYTSANAPQRKDLVAPGFQNKAVPTEIVGVGVYQDVSL